MLIVVSDRLPRLTGTFIRSLGRGSHSNWRLDLLERNGEIVRYYVIVATAIEIWMETGR